MKFSRTRERRLRGLAACRATLCSLIAAMLLVPAADAAAQGRTGSQGPLAPFNILPVTITSVVPDGAGGLVANGIIGTEAFQTPLTLTPQQSGGACPILDLQLGPINLNLLGLQVETSPICLEITAQQGGGLLGDLLCSIANLLNGGTPLGTILEGLTPAQLDLLNRGLTNLLNQVFQVITSSQAVAGASCDILNLAIGPLELNLLGLVVELDDCSGGPVTVDITANPGGGLLGDLLCDLGGLLNRPSSSQAVAKLLRQIAAIIGGLI